MCDLVFAQLGRAESHAGAAMSPVVCSKQPLPATSIESPASGKRGSLLSPRDYEESTEASSSALCSDAESCSGAEGGSDSCADDDVLAGRCLQTHAEPMNRRKCASQRRKSGTSITGTKLATIPGTPHGMTEHPSLFPEDQGIKEDPEEEAMRKLGPLLEPEAFLSTTPQDEKIESLRAKSSSNCVATMVTRPEREPLKVSMIAGGRPTKKEGLDPMVPAKKRPIMAEKPGAAAELLRRLDLGIPVKKRVTPWLTAEPPRFLPAAPR